MNPLDILMMVIVVYCLVMGFFRGTIREVISIIGVAAGFFAAHSYYAKIGKYLSKWISDPGYLNIVSFVLLFTIVFIIISVMGIIIQYLRKKSPNWKDRISGGVFALIKGVLIVSILLVMFTAFFKKGAPVIQKSLFSPYVTLISENIAKVVSKDMKNQYETKVSHLKEGWKSR